MSWRLAVTALAGGVCCAIGAGTAVAVPPGPATAVAANAARPAGHLGKAIQVPGLQALNVKGIAEVSGVRCPAPGSCTAVGSYRDGSGHFQGFVVNETRFKWGKATPVPGLAQLGGGGPTDITALSCPAAGQCTIGGWYVDASANLQPFVDNSTSGVFGPAAGIFTVTDQVSSFIARVTALSCATPGNCTAALEIPEFPPGGGDPIPRAFIVTQASGQWGTPRSVDVPGVSVTTPTGISSISCWSPAECMAVGGSGDGGGNERPIVAIQGSGTWGFQNTVPGLDGQGVTDFNPNADSAALQVSCSEATTCAVSGVYGDHQGNQDVFVASWAGSHWFTQTIPGSEALKQNGEARTNALSCGANGGCAVVGQVTDSESTQSFASSRLGGTWSNAQEIAGIDNLPASEAQAASCPSAGSCLIGGFYNATDTREQAYVADENTTAGTSHVGSFGAAHLIAGNLNKGTTAGVIDISCPKAGECAIGGFYTDSHGHSQGFIATQSARTTTNLTLSTAKIQAGHENTEQLTVQVKPAAGGTPAGQVTIKTGRTTLCTITLKNGQGGCRLSQDKLQPGKHKLTASYSGGTIYAASTSPAKTLTVTK